MLTSATYIKLLKIHVEKQNIDTSNFTGWTRSVWFRTTDIEKRRNREDIPWCQFLTFFSIEKHTITELPVQLFPFYLCQVYRYLLKLFWVSLFGTRSKRHRNETTISVRKTVRNSSSMHKGQTSIKKISTEQDIKYLTYDIICPHLVLNKHRETCNDNPCLSDKTLYLPIQRFPPYGYI